MTESATRTRTRRAIVEAAVHVLARDPSAALGEVAREAGVGRTTVHRYFPERSDLLAALAEHARERVHAAAERAALEHGPAPDALARLCRELLELGDVLTLIFNATVAVAWEEQDSLAAAVTARGHAEGSLDARLGATWVEYMLWAFLYTSWALIREESVPRHEALEQCLLSLQKAVAAP